MVAAGRDPGPLAGVPFGVKDNYDVAGRITTAGSIINRERAPAVRDAILLERLTASGAVLVGTQNMDEYAYGFTTENAHYGATRNPLDTERSAGGSSGGSAASVAAGLCDFSLGRSEEHTSELQSLMRISYAVFCLKKKKKTKRH